MLCFAIIKRIQSCEKIPYSREKEHPMKKTLLPQIPNEMPQEIRGFVSSAAIYDSSSSPEADVYFLDKGNGYYLKCAGKGTLEKEAKMTAYFHGKGLGAEVLHYVSADRDWLLTAAVVGEDCVSEAYLMDPKRLCDTIAQELRKLHETDCSGCPVPDRTTQYLADVERTYQSKSYVNHESRFGFSSAEEAYAVLCAGKDALQSRVLLHGDYCLPNIILRDWQLSGFIDVGFGGVGDRHIDLFWGVWSLWFNLKTNAYCDRFLDAYGRDQADASILKVIAAAEYFG